MKTPEFVNSIIPKESTLDFVVCKLNIKVVDLIEFLKTKQEFASDNNGFITIDVLRDQKTTEVKYILNLVIGNLRSK